MSSEAEHAHPNYVKIWGILVVLLVISVLGPMIGVKLITLLTAFGIAIVKAYLVAVNFMHLNIEKKYVTYLLVTVLAFIALLFFFVAPDVMRHDGDQWENQAAKQEVQRALDVQEAAK
jgi:caa(3)-type oxidase subunit IV